MRENKKYTFTKLACYMTNVSMAVVAVLSPLLFVTFREMYGISYTLLGTLVVINFFTQLCIDLIFTFFSKYFNIHKTVKSMPFYTFVGLIIYGVFPAVFPDNAYLWIAVGTVIFSVSAGLTEVLASPVIAAIPSDNPEREMSKLHSTYAWGVVFIVLISTVFIKVFGSKHWMYLALFWAMLPLIAFLLFQKEELPPMETGAEAKTKGKWSLGIALCFGCIFLGGAAECTMTQWVSGFLEGAIGIPKLLGDILGVAMFAILLGTGRTLYAKFGKNVLKVMLLGMAAATICYIVAGISLNPIVVLFACALTGFCTSMLWPGNIIFVGEKFPEAGVAIYALMAAGGDMGASLCPQLVGIVTDKVTTSAFAAKVSAILSMEVEQIGMRTGLLMASLFPMMGCILILVMRRYFKAKQ